jgi:hypothetical protein
MKIPVTDQLKEICKEIESEGKSEQDWAAIESDDMFQNPPFYGGFDATEGEFCFSYYDDNRAEWWF